MPITRENAAEIARQSLNHMAAEISAYGAALPSQADWTPTELVVTIEEEFDDGWVFGYNTRDFVENGNSVAMLAGNYPIFIDRMDGAVHSTADPEFRHYLGQLGERRRAIKP